MSFKRPLKGSRTLKNGYKRRTPSKRFGVAFEVVAFIGSGIVIALIAVVWLGMFLIIY